MNLESLCQQYERTCQNFPDPLRLRVHRALSWLNKVAATPEDDVNARFIFFMDCV